MLQDRGRFDLVAHFPSAAKARTAGETFGGQVEEDVNVSFGSASWIGLGTGIFLGLALGFLLSKSILTVGFLPAVLIQRGVLLSALWANILGASGWIMGGMMHLFSLDPDTSRYELHITVQPEKLAEMRKLLAAEGATAISVREHQVTDTVARTS
jgi:hypothetical protein